MDDKSKTHAQVQVHYDEVTVVPETRRRRNWIPFVLRTPFLVLVALVLLLCITALQYLVLQSVPLADNATQQNVYKRQTSTTIAAPNATVSYVTNPNAYLRITPTPTPTPVNDLVKIETTPIVDPPVNIVSTPSVSTTPTIIVSYFPDTNGYLDLTTTSSSSASKTTAATTTEAGSSQFSPTGTTGTTQLSSVGSSVASSIGSSINGQTNGNGNTKTDANTVAAQLQTLVSSSTITSVYSSNGKLFTSTGVLVHSTVTTVAPATTSGSLREAITEFQKPSLRLKGTFTWAWYFAAMFSPSIIAVILKEVWAVIAHDMKMIEPFYKLNHVDGATAKESLLADYLSSTTSWYSLSAAFKGDLVMVGILMVNLIMSILAPVASESMTVIATYIIRDQSGTDRPYHPAWVLSLPLIRILQATLALTTFVVISLAIFARRRRSGLCANPSKIATMASLINHPSMVQDLQNIHPDASDRNIEQTLAHHRYMITQYRDQHGDSHCGLVRMSDAAPEGLQRVPLEDMAGPLGYAGLPQSDEHGHHRVHRSTSQKVFDGIFLALVSGMLVVLIAYRSDKTDSGFNRFFNSGQFGPKFILSMTASIITIAFQNFEREVRLLTPYRHLAARQAPAKKTILPSLSGTGASNLFRSIRLRNWYHVFIATTALLGDVLIIAVTGVPFNQNLSWATFNISMAVSIFIILTMITATVTIFRWRRTNQKMNIPQKPNESLIRSWMSLSNQGNQLRGLVGDLGDASAETIQSRVRQDGGAYSAGWIKNEHGQDMWCVDKELDQYYGGRSRARDH